MQTSPHNATIGEVADSWRLLDSAQAWYPSTRHSLLCLAPAQPQHYVVLQISVYGRVNVRISPYILSDWSSEMISGRSSETFLRMISAFGNRPHVMAKFSECFVKYCSCILKINRKDNNTLCGTLPKADVISLDFCSPGNGLILDR
jgi:hypothetical protein